MADKPTAAIALRGEHLWLRAARGRDILRDCSFAIEQGSCVAILGPNGAGKTTLLRLCNGLTIPSSGNMFCFDERINSATARKIRRRIAFVSQFRGMDKRQPITVFESVLTGCFGKLGLLRRPGRRERQLAEQSLEAVSSSHLAGRPLGHLSGGEAQRAAIARALTQEPDILLLDEPTASLDWRAKAEILQLIGQLRQKFSLTIVMITHELNALIDLSDRIIFLKNGELVWSGQVAEGLRQERLSAMYDTPVTVIHHHGRPVILM
ncbi:MAG: ABC transporter ATP-binding protein [Desulfobulbaceae bacterium]|nr:ABC transporter ATP-binding protein [Desulfobulbaceae bacterium]